MTAFNKEQELARERARGSEVAGGTGIHLNRRWCFWCKETKPTFGGTQPTRQLFRCAECQPEKKTI